MGRGVRMCCWQAGHWLLQLPQCEGCARVMALLGVCAVSEED
jgi:hypothetical protein